MRIRISIKRLICFICMVILLAFISVGAYIIYWSYHPDIRVSHGGGGRGVGYWYEPVTISYGTRHDIPMASSIQVYLEILFCANELIGNDLYNNYMAPTNVKSSGEIKDGKSIFRYEGIVTTKDGITRPFEKEVILDFVIDPDMNF